MKTKELWRLRNEMWNAWRAYVRAYEAYMRRLRIMKQAKI